MIGIAAIAGKRSQQNVDTYRNSSQSDENQNKWVLSERDIAFLIAQTGKYRYLFYAHFINP